MKKNQRTQEEELLIYGRRAVQAVWELRREAIIRAYATAERSSWLGEMLKWCADRRKAYHMVSNEELEKITHAVHHEGVAILVKAKAAIAEAVLLDGLTKHPGAVVFLHGVENPHNVGAIMRTMAHFGSIYLVGEAGALPELSSAALRISEGGSELVEVHRSTNALGLLATLKKRGYTVIALSSKADQGLYQASLPERCVLLLGNEIYGLPSAMQKAADLCLAIPGTGKMGSLNVSTTAGIFLGEWYRRHRVQRG